MISTSSAIEHRSGADGSWKFIQHNARLPDESFLSGGLQGIFCGLICGPREDGAEVRETGAPARKAGLTVNDTRSDLITHHAIRRRAGKDAPGFPADRLFEGGTSPTHDRADTRPCIRREIWIPDAASLTLARGNGIEC